MGFYGVCFFFFLLMEDTKVHAAQQGTLFCRKDVAPPHIQAQMVLAKWPYLKSCSSHGGALNLFDILPT